MLKRDSYSQSKSYQHLTPVVVVLVVAIAGTLLLIGSHAASPFVSLNAGNGTVAGPAAKQTCAGASSGSCVRFGQALPMDGNVALALSAPGTPFAASSFWNTLLPASTPVNPNNAAYLNAIAYNLCGGPTVTSAPPPTPCPTPNYNGALNTSAWSAPLYVVPAGQPTVNVAAECNGTNTAFAAARANVPVPADAHGSGETAVPDTDTDKEIQIYQPSTDKYWDFWNFQKDGSGNWEACWGGTITGVSQSDGLFASHTGAMATSLPLIGATPRIEELRAGTINHVIGLTIGDVASGDLKSTVIPANTPGATSGVSWPASRGDGGSTDPLAIPEGLRFRLNPSLDVNTLNLSPVAKVIAVAAQKYGFVVDDSCGQPCVPIRLGDPTAYTSAGLPNPYTSGPGVSGVGNSGLYGGVSGSQIMKNFPWNQLQALPFNYGE